MHLVFACEMGGNLGHISPISQIARHAIFAGHQVTCILPRYSIDQFHGMSDPRIKIIAAPENNFSKATSNILPVSLSESLQLKGYTQIDKLAVLIQSWRKIFLSLKADHIIFDYAPTAQLSCIDLIAKKIMFGSGYCVVPNRQPLPAFNPQSSQLEQRLLKADKFLLKTINQALSQLAMPNLDVVVDLFKVDLKIISSIPELDNYQDYRDQEIYCGFMEPISNRLIKKVKWPSGDKPRVFAYLDARFPFVKSLLCYLDNHYSACIYLGGEPSGQLLSMLDCLGNSIVSSQPFDVGQVVNECELIFCHGGLGLTGQAIMGGRPVVVIPLHYEQQLNAQALETHFLGAQIGPAGNWASLEKKLESIDVVGLKMRTKKFKEHYRTHYCDGHGRSTSQRALDLILGPN